MKSKHAILIRVGFYFGLPLLILWIPWEIVNHSPIICPFRRLWGIKCPGCGMTRAFWQVLHGRFETAIHYNQWVVPVGIILLYFVGKDLQTAIASFMNLKREKNNKEV